MPIPIESVHSYLAITVYYSLAVTLTMNGVKSCVKNGVKRYKIVSFCIVVTLHQKGAKTLIYQRFGAIIILLFLIKNHSKIPVVGV